MGPCRRVSPPAHSFPCCKECISRKERQRRRCSQYTGGKGYEAEAAVATCPCDRRSTSQGVSHPQDSCLYWTGSIPRKQRQRRRCIRSLQSRRHHLPLHQQQVPLTRKSLRCLLKRTQKSVTCKPKSKSPRGKPKSSSRSSSIVSAYSGLRSMLMMRGHPAGFAQQGPVGIGMFWTVTVPMISSRSSWSCLVP